MDSDPSIGLLLLGFRLLISPFTVNFTVRISRVHWTFAQQQCVRYLLTIACEEQMQLSIVDSSMLPETNKRRCSAALESIAGAYDSRGARARERQK